MTRPDGGNAFPHLKGLYQQTPRTPADPDFMAASDGGMTLRDYFAAAAITGIISRSQGLNDEERALWAFMVADKMLAARDAE